MKKTLCKISIFLSPALLAILSLGGLCLFLPLTIHGQPSLPGIFQPEYNSAVQEILWPEQYLDPTVKYGLNFVLPDTIREKLVVDTGYDRWSRVPTLKLDYFVPIKAWPDRTLFVSPRVSLSGNRESYSVGAGMRKMLGSDTLVGVHAFHDWVRARGTKGGFLQEIGMGLELSTLPGKHSDLSLSVNGYLPINEQQEVVREGRALAKERLPYGADGQVSFLFPAISDAVDMRLDAKIHAYGGQTSNWWGHSAGLTVSSRNGMLTASVERSTDSLTGDNFQARAGLSLAFDWTDMVAGKNPFSSPYEASPHRFDRKIRNSMYARPVRQHELPMERTERLITLVSAVHEDTVVFRGAFPDHPNSRVTVQVAQSPWRDIMELNTDSKGAFSGKVKLPAGEYRVRLIHKPSGLVTTGARIVVEDSRSPDWSTDAAQGNHRGDH
ncbi:MAG: inverse autotransporter beta domain-containing protein [Thermodesulfobacteriota bacterium]